MGWQPKGNPLSDVDFISKAKCELKFSLWPRRCDRSNKLIWLRFGYRARRNSRLNDVGFAYDDRWYSTPEFIILRLVS